MAVQNRRSLEYGLALLETALVMTILVSLLLSVVGIFDYVVKGSIVSHVLDQFLQDQEIRAFELQGTVLHLAEDRLRAYLPQMVSRIEANLVAAFSRDQVDSSRYLIEAEFVTFEIDTASGEPERTVRYPNAKFTRGSLALPQNARQQLSFDLEYATMLERGGRQYAIPTGQFGQVSALDRYLPFTPILAVRVAVSLEGTFTGSVLQMLSVSDNPMVTDLKAVTLRGEVG